MADATLLRAPVRPPADDVPVSRGPSPVLTRWLPMALLAGVFALLAVFVGGRADAYGRTWDEGLQDWYGKAVLSWYQTQGADLTFTQAWEGLHMPEHGAVVETVIAYVQQHTGETWHTRAMVGGLVGALGVVAIALCGLELAGWWGALLAAVGLLGYPRYLGAIFNNTKDVPLAVAMTLVLWMTMRVARRFGDGFDAARDVGLGMLLGVAAAIRVTALVWLGVLGLLAAAWFVRQARQEGRWRRAVRPLARSALLIIGVCYLTMLALWPYLAMHPLTGIPDALAVMSRYDWLGPIPFEGVLTPAPQLPRWYAPEWLVIGSPLPVVALGVVGLGVIARDRLLGRARAADLLAAALLVVPVSVLVVTRPTLYNGLRHFLFVVPGLILVAVVGAVRLWRRARPCPALAVALVGALLTGQAEALAASVRLYPLEYTYFSPLVGGFNGASGRYETDYWRACDTLALRWVAGQPHRPGPATVGGVLSATADAAGMSLVTEHPDFFVSNPWADSPAGYLHVHDIVRDGRVVCAVHRAPNG